MGDSIYIFRISNNIKIYLPGTNGVMFFPRIAIVYIILLENVFFNVFLFVKIY